MPGNHYKTALKRSLAALALCLGLLLCNAIWFKPFSINVLFLRVSMEFGWHNPEGLSAARILEPFGIKYHQGLLNDASQAFIDSYYDRAKTNLEQLQSYDESSLSKSTLLSKRILEDYLQTEIANARFRGYNYPFNQLFGLQSQFPTFMKTHHLIHSKRDAWDYIRRLSAAPQKFEQALDRVKTSASKGIIPPAFVIERVLEQMRNFVSQPLDDNILIAGLEEKMQQADFNDASKKELMRTAKQVTTQALFPAYQELINYFDALLLDAGPHDGAWKHPDGEAYYRQMIRYHTTTAMSAEEIHQLGLTEVARIQAQIRQALNSMGVDSSGSFLAALERLHDRPALYYPESDSTRETIIADYTLIVEEISQGLTSNFHPMAIGKVVVERIPPFKEETSPAAYYHAASLDGERPGIFFINLAETAAYSRLGMRTLAYHEAIPGHHFQISIQQQLQDVAFFRKFIHFTAYIEGWALYAEHLAWEAGFHSDAVDNIGRLQAELFRAVRLVVDTGIHYKRWNREEAIRYMHENTAKDTQEVRAEVERYIVNPGQALAYKIGMLKILDLREKARRQLGDQFDIRDFHDAVLRHGALPLSILEQQIDAHIKQIKDSSSLDNKGA